jgi:hypothetical protein
VVLSLLLLIRSITFNDLHVLTIPTSLTWKCPDRGVWSFWYVLEFSFTMFYWGFLHLCSLKRLACSSFFVLCPCPYFGISVILAS